MFSSAKSNGVHGASPATLSKSLRLRSSASASLRRTFSTSGTNNKIRTISTWVKRGILGTVQVIMGGDDGGANQSRLLFQTDDTLNLRLGGSASNDNVTTAVFRDPSAWYHIVALIDTTQATAANRAKIYVNGVQQTIPSPTSIQNQTTAFANPSASNTIGEVGGTGSYYLDGYLTDFYFIDGQALTPSSFAFTNATTGQWSPATYSGYYGTNGFHLTFANTTSTTTLGYDTSGNSNNWTTNNISLTAGSTYDSMNDVPVAYSATANNYAVINPLAGSLNSVVNLTNGNLFQSSVSGSGWSRKISSIGFTSGKFYAEFTISTVGDNALAWGITNIPPTEDANNQNGQFAGYSVFVVAYFSAVSAYNRLYQPSGSYTTLGGSSTAGDVYGIAMNADTNTVYFYQNGNVLGSAAGYALTSNGTPYFFQSITQPGGAGSFNFGQQPFTYTPPSGFVALNTYNLPTPTIAQGNKYMDATLYTGNGTSQTITNAGLFQPDFVWAKGRSDAYSNILVNAVTGANQFLLTDSTQAEATSSALVSAFTSSGFSIGSSTSINNSSSTYVGWQWKANGSGSSNTNGSITSTVSANTTAGFSIVTYTGTGSNATVGHGLGVAPSMIIGKARNSVVDWRAYHTSIGAANFLVINTNAASASGATWNSTTPTSTVFTVGGGSNMNVDSSTTYVAYCFAPIAGFSAFGSYTGNNSTDGPFVYCGFRPAYIMVKRSSSAGNNWQVLDTKRSTYNVMADYFYASSSAKENYDTAVGIDSLSNGFKIRGTDGNTNSSGATYIYMAFAENPFQYANAR